MALPVLKAEIRKETGSKAMKTLRVDNALVPGVIYGKKEDTIHLVAQEQEVRKLIFDRHRLIQIDIKGKKKEAAMFREAQWDLYGEFLIHFDLVRVSLSDKLEVKVMLDFKGYENAPGAKQGGSFDALKKNIVIEGPAAEVPDSIKIDLSDMVLGQKISFADIKIPDNFVLVDMPSDIVAIMHPPKGEEEIEADSAMREGDMKEPKVLTEREKKEEGEA